MSLSFKNIRHSYDDAPVLDNLDLIAENAQITCLLGPSGGGKSTLLRLAAGLEKIQSGEIHIDGECIASSTLHPAPESRPVGMMFQENALFPNMTVGQNIAFGIAHLNTSKQEQRINELLAMVGLADFAERYPHELSGGQQQRIALVRSLAPEPKILLMDEPYANIDITLRRSLREAARKTIKQDGTTVVLVTHDPEEAMEMADVIAVLDKGKIVQAGSPQGVYENPKSESVAALFGGAQSMAAIAEDGRYKTEYGYIEPPLTQSELPHKGHIVFRPQGMSVEHDSSSSLIVEDIRYVGDAWLGFLVPNDAPAATKPLRVALSDGGSFAIADTVSLQANHQGFFVFPEL